MRMAGEFQSLFMSLIMQKEDELRAISRLVFELTVTSSTSSDLDVLLARLLAILLDYRNFPVEALVGALSKAPL